MEGQTFKSLGSPKKEPFWLLHSTQKWLVLESTQDIRVMYFFKKKFNLHKIKICGGEMLSLFYT